MHQRGLMGPLHFLEMDYNLGFKLKKKKAKIPRPINQSAISVYISAQIYKATYSSSQQLSSSSSMGNFSTDNPKQQIKPPYVQLANQKNLFPTPNLKNKTLFFFRQQLMSQQQSKMGSIGNDRNTYNVGDDGTGRHSTLLLNTNR